MLTPEKLSQKWSDFVAIRSKHEKEDPIYVKARNELLEIYYPLVTKVAERMHKKIREVDIDDLVSWGTDGLYHAVDRFDPDLKNKFETFAIHRIRGSILDNIRQVDWVPRLVRQRYGKIQKAKHQLECDLGRTPNDDEVAAALSLSVDEYLEMASKANPIGCVSMFAGGSHSTDGGEELQIESVTTNDRHPLGKVVKEEMFKKLLGKNFVPLERKIIHMHYYGDMTMKEIAAETGYSESRISQMHAKILERLQKKVTLNPEYMSGLVSILQA
jgi:RNA polymerase sigma factor for flagellar operon FliA